MIKNKFQRYKFQSYEVVKIQPKNGVLENMSDINAGEFDYQSLIGKEGIVLGTSDSDDGSEFCYLVTFDPMDEDAAFFFREKDLVSTGVIKKEEGFMSGESIRVRVDPKTGEGEIIEDDEE